MIIDFEEAAKKRKELAVSEEMVNEANAPVIQPQMLLPLPGRP